MKSEAEQVQELASKKFKRLNHDITLADVIDEAVRNQDRGYNVFCKATEFLNFAFKDWYLRYDLEVLKGMAVKEDTKQIFRDHIYYPRVEQGVEMGEDFSFFGDGIPKYIITDPYLIKRLAEEPKDNALLSISGLKLDLEEENSNAKKIIQMIDEKRLTASYKQYLLNIIYGIQFSSDDKKFEVISPDKFHYRYGQYDQLLNFCDSKSDQHNRLKSNCDAENFDLVIDFLGQIKAELQKPRGDCDYLIAAFEKVKTARFNDYKKICTVSNDIKDFFEKLEDDLEFFAPEYSAFKALQEAIKPKSDLDFSQAMLDRYNNVHLVISNSRFGFNSSLVQVRSPSLLCLIDEKAESTTGFNRN